MQMEHQVLSLADHSTSQAVAQKKLNRFIQEFRDGKHEGSIVSTQTVDSLAPDNREAWRAIRRDLEDIGISVAAFDANRDFLMTMLKNALSTGALEEQTADGGSSTIVSENGISFSLKDPEHDAVSTQPIEDLVSDMVS